MNNTFNNLTKLPSLLYNSIGWGWNPTHTDSAIRAIEIFLNSKQEYPRINKMFEENSELQAQFESKEFANDMSQNWNIEQLQSEYEKGTLGYEYSIFMQKLGFEPLSINLSDNIPKLIQNMFRLGVRNHDLIHLLFGLYDTVDDQISITDFHEWVFLVWANEVGEQKQKVVDLLLLPSRLKSKFQNNKRSFELAEKIGKELAKNSTDLNLVWLQPDFGTKIKDIRLKYGIKTMQEVIDILDSEKPTKPSSS